MPRKKRTVFSREFECQKCFRTFEEKIERGRPKKYCGHCKSCQFCGVVKDLQEFGKTLKGAPTKDCLRCKPLREAAKKIKAQETQAIWNEANREKMKGVWYKNTVKRYALKRGASGEPEPFFKEEVWYRDGGICWLCGLPCSKEFDFKDPTSFTVDHIIPVVLGGSHTLDNVKGAHLHCNLSKHDTLPTEIKGTWTLEKHHRMRIELGVRGMYLFTPTWAEMLKTKNQT